MLVFARVTVTGKFIKPSLESAGRPSLPTMLDPHAKGQRHEAKDAAKCGVRTKSPNLTQSRKDAKGMGLLNEGLLFIAFLSLAFLAS